MIKEHRKVIYKVQFPDGTWYKTTSKKKHRELLIKSQPDMSIDHYNKGAR